jgi:hypothetical protein
MFPNEVGLPVGTGGDASAERTPRDGGYAPHSRCFVTWNNSSTPLLIVWRMTKPISPDVPLGHRCPARICGALFF